ncbi:MAG: metallophosphoesterase [Desulfobacteraceae bacterium]|jgi:hypothetical protein
MLTAIMSDSHDHLHMIEKALSICRQKKIEAIIHCGDFVAPFSLKLLASLNIPFYGVFGNNDGDRIKMIEYTKTILKNVRLYERFGDIKLNSRRIAFTHYFDTAKPLAKSGLYDLVCFGHSHTWYCKKMNTSVLLNPGEIMGKEGNPGFAVYNTKTNEITKVTI